MEELTLDKVRELWSTTYNTGGKPDWSHIFSYYRPDVVFQDCIQRVEGIDNFKALCNRLVSRSKELKMKIHSIAKENMKIHIEWTMTIMFKKFPSTPLNGATVLTLHEDGRIISQRDYYDLWGDIFNQIPWFKNRYRRFMAKKFG